MDELEKLFAEATASVKRATAPRKEPEAPVLEATAPAPAPVVEAPAPPPQAAPAPAAPAPPPRPAPAAAGGIVQVTAGTQSDQGLQLEGQDLPWSGIQALCLGRAGTTQIIGLRQGGTVYLIAQDKVNLRGLVRQAQVDSVGNWRRLIVELAEKVESADPGIAAITSGGGMIPKYASPEAFVEHVKGA